MLLIHFAALNALIKDFIILKRSYIRIFKEENKLILNNFINKIFQFMHLSLSDFTNNRSARARYINIQCPLFQN